MLEHLTPMPRMSGRQPSELALQEAAHSPTAARLVQYSRLILAIYGGAIMALLNSVPESLRMRGVSTSSRTLPASQPMEHRHYQDETDGASVFSFDLADESQLRAITNPTSTDTADSETFSYLDLLGGSYDHYLLHDAAGVAPESAQLGSYDEPIPETLDRASEPPTTSKPTYYVITSEAERKIIVVMRGTITLGDVATDLACESADVDGLFADIPAGSRVHSGMLITAKAIGGRDRAVHRAVREALQRHPDFDVDLIGHSLGAGVVALLALLWGSPLTGRTRPDSGLGDRNLHAYCYAVPCVMDAKLGEHCHRLITSFVSSWDLVSRLSLGSVTDIRNVIAWLCKWESDSTEDFNSNDFIRKTFEHQVGRLDDSVSGKSRFEEQARSLSSRLHDHMHGVHLFPPGRIFISFEARDLHAPESSDFSQLYEVTGDRSIVFDRITFAGGMLGGHLPHRYVAVLTTKV